MTTESEVRTKELETEYDRKVWLWPAVSFTISIIITIAINIFISSLTNPDVITDLIKYLSEVARGEKDLEQLALKLLGVVAHYKNLLDWIFILLGALIALFISVCVAALVGIYGRLKHLDRISFEIYEDTKLQLLDFDNLKSTLNSQLVNYQTSISSLLQDLESRHNIIQNGTEYGRVLALRPFENLDLEEGDPFYNKVLTTNHCIASTLVRDRIEELLTSSEYMQFFVDNTLPSHGYFRLVLSREPKDFEGLSAYGTVSHKLKYKTSIIPLDCWKTRIIPTLHTLLEPETCKGLIQLVERNTELGIKDTTLDDLTNTDLSNVTYCGRIEKLEQDKVDGKSTITSFRSDNHDPIKEIPIESIFAYSKLMGVLYEKYTMDRFKQDDLKTRFRGSYYDDLCHDIRSTFRKRPE